MRILTALVLVGLAASGTARADDWVGLEGQLSCANPYEVVCDESRNPNLISLRAHFADLMPRLRAAGQSFDSRERCRDLTEEACMHLRQEHVWTSVFPAARGARLQELFEETKAATAVFLGQRRSEILAAADRGADKRDELRLMDLAVQRLGTMRARYFQTDEALRSGSAREATRYFIHENVVEFGAIALLPAVYDEAIRVILGHEVAHSFGPRTLFAVEAGGESTGYMGRPVRSIYRDSYPFRTDIAQLPAYLRGADRACLREREAELASRLATNESQVRDCDEAVCLPTLEAANECRKDCRTASDRAACFAGCEPLVAAHRECARNICTAEERAFRTAHLRDRSNHEALIVLLANPYANGNRAAPECGRAQTEEVFGDLIGMRLAIAQAAGPSEVRRIFETSSTYFCQLDTRDPEPHATAHPPVEERINRVHLEVPGVRQALGCAN